mmetsp:Transcript_44680/g.136314  ORF Transcript_44680/g.136314 Transcript_44680/m.136314 type:complete len:262 (+) Transcript_44680:2970-3755(+)
MYSMNKGQPLARSCIASSIFSSTSTVLSCMPRRTLRYVLDSTLSMGLISTLTQFERRDMADAGTLGGERDEMTRRRRGHSRGALLVSSRMMPHELGSISPSPSKTSMRGWRGRSTFMSESTMALIMVLGFCPLSRLSSCASVTVGTMDPMLTLSIFLRTSCSRSSMTAATSSSGGFCIPRTRTVHFCRAISAICRKGKYDESESREVRKDCRTVKSASPALSATSRMRRDLPRKGPPTIKASFGDPWADPCSAFIMLFIPP